MSDNSRIIHTGVYSDHAFNIIGRVFSQLRRNGARGTSRTASKTKVERALDGEVVLRYERPSKSYYYEAKTAWTTRKTDDAARDWVADYMKAVVKAGLSHIGDFYDALIKKCESWKPGNWDPAPNIVCAACDSDAATFGSDAYSVRDVYCLYNLLKNRKTTGFSKQEVDRMKGEAYDPVKTEMNAARKEATEQLNTQLNNDISAAEREMYDQMDKLRAVYREKCEALRKKHKADIAALDEMFSMTAGDGTTPSAEAACA